MAITKGIVSGGNYTFSAANQRITFSSDYLGMSLSDITYITNIKSGVATVIYDPFDAAKGGVLNGLTLTLAYNTTLMGNTDPLQIIVGFTPSNPAPINVNVVDSPEQESQRDLLQNISDDLDFIALAMDNTEGVQINTREANPAKRDVNNAQIPSDAPSPITGLLTNSSSFIIVDTTGYQSIEINCAGNPNANMTVRFDASIDRINWSTAPTIDASSPSTAQQAGFTIASNQTRRFNVPVISKFLRIGVNSYTAGVTSILAYLRQVPIVTGPFTQIPVNANLGTIGGSAIVNLNAGIATNSGAGQSTAGGFTVAGSSLPTQNPPNANSTLSTTVPYPVGISGREQPYVGALAGIHRYLTLDGGGRTILGGDTPDTETRTQSKLASGAIPGIPPRGIGARSNNMFGSQSLLVENTSQSEGDTIPTLLQQILVELKMLNQQINEIPLTLNFGIKMQNEVSDYRQEEYNNHVNNQ
jgi:hypothetical protein